MLIFIDTAAMAFKLLFHQSRPYWLGGVKPLAEETSYGIPSTHASDSLAVGGYLAYSVKKDVVLDFDGTHPFLDWLIPLISWRSFPA